jgi:hypothetical protein
MFLISNAVTKTLSGLAQFACRLVRGEFVTHLLVLAQ